MNDWVWMIASIFGGLKTNTYFQAELTELCSRVDHFGQTLDLKWMDSEERRQAVRQLLVGANLLGPPSGGAFGKIVGLRQTYSINIILLLINKSIPK